MTDTIKESHELITPVIIGTPEERIEALNLWTTLVTTLKKMSELPSNENKLALLRGARDQSECDLDRVTNIAPVPAPVAMAPATPVPTPEVPVNVPTRVEPDYYEQQDDINDGLVRLQELAGITVRPV